jgi:endo-alpha-1,4-polygalactosaminidase (GH114 family)
MDIAEYTRNQVPGFIVIAQNAAELAVDDDYIEIIDAIAQEQVWFDGGSDNKPPGDCPLPATDDDIDTDHYYDSLSRECQQQFDEYPESTLHVSSAEYIAFLRIALGKGIPIFTVDYAMQPKNIDFVYRTSRELGFIPFVSTRFLDQYIDPVP